MLIDEVFTITENPAYVANVVINTVDENTSAQYEFESIDEILKFITTAAKATLSHSFIYKQIKDEKPFTIKAHSGGVETAMVPITITMVPITMVPITMVMTITKNPNRYVIKSKLFDENQRSFFKITDIPKATGISLYNIHKKLHKN